MNKFKRLIDRAPVGKTIKTKKSQLTVVDRYRKAQT